MSPCGRETAYLQATCGRLSLPHVLLAMQKVVGSNPISRFAPLLTHASTRRAGTHSLSPTTYSLDSPAQLTPGRVEITVSARAMTKASAGPRGDRPGAGARDGHAAGNQAGLPPAASRPPRRGAWALLRRGPPAPSSPSGPSACSPRWRLRSWPGRFIKPHALAGLPAFAAFTAAVVAQLTTGRGVLRGGGGNREAISERDRVRRPERCDGAHPGDAREFLVSELAQAAQHDLCVLAPYCLRSWYSISTRLIQLIGGRRSRVLSERIMEGLAALEPRARGDALSGATEIFGAT